MAMRLNCTAIKCIVSVMALILACPSVVNAQGRWKGIDLFFLTDAFQDDVPKGVAVCDNDTFEYGAYKSTETKKYDAHGFYQSSAGSAMVYR